MAQRTPQFVQNSRTGEKTAATTKKTRDTLKVCYVLDLLPSQVLDPEPKDRDMLV
jgi:hypothetical protein